MENAVGDQTPATVSSPKGLSTQGWLNEEQYNKRMAEMMKDPTFSMWRFDPSAETIWTQVQPASQNP